MGYPTLVGPNFWPNSSISLIHALCLSTLLTERPMSFTPRLAKSSERRATSPSSVVQTGVKSSKNEIDKLVRICNGDEIYQDGRREWPVFMVNMGGSVLSRRSARKGYLRTHLPPSHSWKLILPWVVSAWKSGAVLPRRKRSGGFACDDIFWWSEGEVLLGYAWYLSRLEGGVFIMMS